MSKTDLVIPELTDEHRASFPAFVEEWTAIGRSTEEMNRALAADGVVSAYRAAGLEAPRIFFAVSPVGGATMRSLLLGHFDARVGAGVGDGVRAGVWAGVGDGVWAGVRGGVGDGVWAGVGDGVWAGVGDGVGDGVWAGVGDGVGDGWWKEVIYGAHEAGWLSHYDWFARQGMQQTCEPIKGLTTVAKNAGWWWAHKGFAVISDRPATLHDEHIAGTTHQRRLHNNSGPSVTYRDGWSLWHWHGQLVPQWVIENPTIEQIGAETNTEIRRCAIENYGWDRYLDRTGVTAVDEVDDPGNPGHTLRLFDLPDSMQLYGDPVRLLVMENASLDRDGSRRVFAETVPVDCVTALEAAAWQFDVPVDEYSSMARAT